jgi:hypothetical protein
MHEGWYKDGNQHASSEIAADVLRLITGYQALNHPPPEDKDSKLFAGGRCRCNAKGPREGARKVGVYPCPAPP